MKKRMNILISNHIISRKTYESVLSVVDYFNHEWGLSESNEQYQMIMTHLARATDRIKQGNAIEEGLDSETYNEIKSMADFPIIEDINNHICRVMELDNVPKEENSFFLLNVASLYNMRR